jgi:thioredoxin 1
MAVLHTNSGSFDKVINQDLPVLVDFWAPWCGPCKMLGPVLEEVEKEVAGKAVVAKVNVDDEQDLAVKFGVSSIPTMIVFKKGQGVDRSVGFMSKEKIVSMLEKHY